MSRRAVEEELLRLGVKAPARPAAESEWKAEIREELAAAREQTLAMLAPIADEAMQKQVSSIMSPLVWDLAHIGYFEELWLVRELGGAVPLSARHDDIYDAFQHERSTRAELPLLSPAEAREYLAAVRARTLELLDRMSLSPDNRLLAHGFVYGMIVQHERQHQETMLATLQLRDAPYPPAAAAPDPPARGPRPGDEVLVPGGPFTIGTDTEPWAYDNERPAVTIDIPAFWIDVAPVTNRQYLAFIADGGYERERLWSGAGWRWRGEAGAEHPEFWRRRDDGSWVRRRFGVDEPLVLDEPVMHVSWYEADAYARWIGKRLPHEAEWEKAATCGRYGRKRRYPWGAAAPAPATANLGGRLHRPAPVGAYPAGASPWGCHQMIGDVWEWTDSDFHAYPGFEAFPYAEYSEVFFGGDYKVLRGGSWATHPSVLRATFRNWDYPNRRQIFSGFRCARDA